MSRIIFGETYVTVIPEYECTGVHKHGMLHMFVGKGALTLNEEWRGRLIILEQDVEHARPKGDLLFFMFVDPTSCFAEKLRKDFLKGGAVYASDEEVPKAELTEAGIKSFIRDYFGQESFLRRDNIDARIQKILVNADQFRYLETRVSELAALENYSESYLTHLFKNETGVGLKQYLLLRRMEYVWRKIAASASITEAAMEAGFASPSHFSDTCRKLMGISAADVLKR